MKYKLTTEEAESLLPDGDYVHTFMNPGVNCLFGADWERIKVLEVLAKCPVELSGKHAAGMDHGIAAKLAAGYLFIATDKEKLTAFEKSKAEEPEKLSCA